MCAAWLWMRFLQTFNNVLCRSIANSQEESSTCLRLLRLSLSCKVVSCRCCAQLHSSEAIGEQVLWLQVAHMGVTTAAVIHQPSYQVFAMFDDVLLLCKGGRTVYAGPECQVQGYFEGLGYALPGKQNPADFYMDITAGIVPLPGQEVTSAQVRSFVGPHLSSSSSMLHHLISACLALKLEEGQTGQRPRSGTCTPRIIPGEPLNSALHGCHSRRGALRGTGGNLCSIGNIDRLQLVAAGSHLSFINAWASDALRSHERLGIEPSCTLHAWCTASSDAVRATRCLMCCCLFMSQVKQMEPHHQVLAWILTTRFCRHLLFTGINYIVVFLQDLATLWEMHAGTPDATLAELDGGSESGEDTERELEHTMSRHLGDDDLQGNLTGRLHLRWLWLAFWAGAFLRERFSDAR